MEKREKEEVQTATGRAQDHYTAFGYRRCQSQGRCYSCSQPRGMSGHLTSLASPTTFVKADLYAVLETCRWRSLACAVHPRQNTRIVKFSLKVKIHL